MIHSNLLRNRHKSALPKFLKNGGKDEKHDHIIKSCNFTLQCLTALSVIHDKNVTNCLIVNINMKFSFKLTIVWTAETPPRLPYLPEAIKAFYGFRYCWLWVVTPVLPPLKLNGIKVIVILLDHDISMPFSMSALNWEKQLLITCCTWWYCHIKMKRKLLIRIYFGFPEFPMFKPWVFFFKYERS